MSVLSTISIGIALLLTGLGYNKSKTRDDKFRFACVLISIVGFATLIQFIVGCWNFNNVGSLSKEHIASVYQLPMVLLFPIAYFFIALIVLCFHNWKKEGSDDLREFFYNKLVIDLVVGLGVGLTLSVILTIIFSVILTIIFCLILDQTYVTNCLIFSLNLSLIIGLSGGLSSGLYLNRE